MVCEGIICVSMKSPAQKLRILTKEALNRSKRLAALPSARSGISPTGRRRLGKFLQEGRRTAFVTPDPMGTAHIVAAGTGATVPPHAEQMHPATAIYGKVAPGDLRRMHPQARRHLLMQKRYEQAITHDPGLRSFGSMGDIGEHLRRATGGGATTDPLTSHVNAYAHSLDATRSRVDALKQLRGDLVSRLKQPLRPEHIQRYGDTTPSPYNAMVQRHELGEAEEMGRAMRAFTPPGPPAGPLAQAKQNIRTQTRISGNMRSGHQGFKPLFREASPEFAGLGTADPRGTLLDLRERGGEGIYRGGKLVKPVDQFRREMGYTGFHAPHSGDHALAAQSHRQRMLDTNFQYYGDTATAGRGPRASLGSSASLKRHGILDSLRALRGPSIPPTAVPKPPRPPMTVAQPGILSRLAQGVKGFFRR